MQTQIVEVGDGFGADVAGVFADAAGEDEGVYAAAGDRHRGDVFGEAVGHDFESEACAFVAFVGGDFEGAAVVGKLGDAEQS